MRCHITSTEHDQSPTGLNRTRTRTHFVPKCQPPSPNSARRRPPFPVFFCVFISQRGLPSRPPSAPVVFVVVAPCVTRPPSSSSCVLPLLPNTQPTSPPVLRSLHHALILILVSWSSPHNPTHPILPHLRYDAPRDATSRFSWWGGRARCTWRCGPRTRSAPPPAPPTPPRPCPSPP